MTGLDDTGVAFADGTKLATAMQLGMRNHILNGNFAVNQIPVAGSVVLTAGQYGHDGWKAGAGGCSYTFAASGNDTVITISAGTLIQVIEDKHVEGGIFTFSQAGNAQGRIAINNGTPSGGYAALPLTTSTATGGQAITVEFTTGTVSKVQVEPGTLPSIFERRLFASELALCKRYFQKGSLYATGQAPAGAYLSAVVCYMAEMRANPTVVQTSTGASGCDTVALNTSASATGFTSYRLGIGGGTASYNENWTASARL